MAVNDYKIAIDVFMLAEDEATAVAKFREAFDMEPLFKGGALSIHYDVEPIMFSTKDHHDEFDAYQAAEADSATTLVDAGELQSSLMEVLAAADMRAAMLDSLEPWAANGLREYIAYVQEWAEDNRFIVIQGIGPDGVPY